MSSQNTDDHFVKVMNNALPHLYYSTDIAIQKNDLNALDMLIRRCENARQRFIGIRNEKGANASFRARLVADGVREFLRMWIHLKEDMPIDAWNSFASSESILINSQRIAHESATDVLIDRLHVIESTVFPRQIFASAGFVFSQAHCSICGSPSGDCHHVPGRVYMGEFCTKKVPTSELTEVSIVTNPRDKRCRATSFSDGEHAFCTLTHRVLPNASNSPQSPEQPSSDTISTPWNSDGDLENVLTKAIESSLPLCFATCDTKLQFDKVKQLAGILEEAERYKKIAIEARNETSANLSFICWHLVRALIGHLQIWLYLKNNEPSEAYDELVEAQECLETVLRFRSNDRLRIWQSVLLQLEYAAFPPQSHMSVSHTFSHAECTICEQEYGQCDHVAGRLYMGQICKRHFCDVGTINHIAFVKHPRDKGCRIAKTKENGFWYCTLTGRRQGRAKKGEGNAQARILRAR